MIPFLILAGFTCSFAAAAGNAIFKVCGGADPAWECWVGKGRAPTFPILLTQNSSWGELFYACADPKWGK